MNKWIGIGRLVRDPELRFAANTGTAVASFTLAVNKNFKNKDGKIEADFISCKAFNKTAEIIANNLSKGNLMAVSGRIQTGSYTNSAGQKVYTTEVIVDEFQFLEKKESNTPIAPQDKDFTVADNLDNIPF